MKRQLAGLFTTGFAVLAIVGGTGTGNRVCAQETPFIAPPEPILNFPDGGAKAQLIEATQLIQAAEARDDYEVTGAGLAVAVLDTGINTTHIDFAGRLQGQRNFTADNGGNVNNAEDGQGHGSNVSGIVMANGNHVGIAPGANVFAYKVLPNAGSGQFAWVRDALADVIANRVARNTTVVNMSLGDSQNWTTDTFATTVYNEIIAHINTLRASGVVVCVSAGNSFFGFGSAQGMGFPGVARGTTSVGAVYDANVGGFSYGSGAIAVTTAPRQITPFSQRLHSSTNAILQTNMFAPGAPMTSSGIGGTNAESVQHGTSQASPCLAGVVLLMQEYHFRYAGSYPTVDQIETWLAESSEAITDNYGDADNVTNTGLDFRMVNAYAALERVRIAVGGPEPNEPPTFTPILPVSVECDSFNTVVLSTTVDDPDGDDLTVTWTVGGIAVQTTNVPAGTVVEFEWNYDHGATIVGVIVEDADTNVSGGTTVTVSDTTDPIVTVSADVTVPVDKGEIVATNVDLGTPAVFDACDADPTITNDSLTEYRIGETTVTWTVTDDFANVTTVEQKVTVLNAAPEALAGRNLSKTTTSATTGSVKLDGSASSDEDEHDLTYLWEADGVTFDDETSAKPTGVFPLGATSVTLTVTDEAGESTTDTLVVSLTGRETRSLGFYANYYATYGYLYAYYSVAGGNYQTDNLTGYQYALYGYLYGYYADDVIEWDEDNSKSDAVGEYMTLRYYQALYDQYGSQNLYRGYTATGDVNSIYAYLFAYYGQIYGEADMSN